MADTVVDSVTIVGFGLIGASLAAALAENAPSVRVSAIDLPEVATLPDARQRVNTLASSEDEALCRRLVAESTLTVLAGPVGMILSELPGRLELARVLTDCGSTKRQVAASVSASPRRGRFVPGHPMAGKTERGFRAAEAKLFEGKPWIYCPERCDDDAVATVLELTRLVGAEPVEMSAEMHDSAVAITSHVPKLLASVLVKLCREGHAEAARGPAFKRATKSASGEVGIWKDILLTNADEVAATTQRLSAELSALAEALSRGDIDQVVQLLERSRGLD